MEPSFVWEVFKGSDQEGTLQARAGVRSGQGDEIVYLVSPCSSVEQFEGEINRLKGELDNLFVQVKTKWHSLAESHKQSLEQDRLEEPESIWKDMEAFDSNEEMISYFNGLDEEVRKKVAEYILSNVNMFQGKGPVFASHYNMFTYKLE